MATLGDRLTKVEKYKTPVVVDASNNIIGSLVQFNAPSNERRLDVYDAVSNAIYPVNPITGNYSEYADTTVWFTSTDCSGQAYAYDTNSNYAITAQTQKRFFVFDSFSPVTILAHSELNQGCDALNYGRGYTISGYDLVKEVTPSFTFPLAAPLRISSNN
jgi:hypothetical protein